MIRYRGWFFLLAVAMFAVAWPLSQQLKLDRSLERMFPSGDPDRNAFELLESRFGVSRFLVFAYRDPTLWESSGKGIERAKQFRSQLEAIQGVRYALDISRIDDMLQTLRGPSLFGVLTAKPPHPLLDPKDRIAEEYRDLFVGQTHARDTDLVAIGVLLDPKTDPASSQRTLTELRTLSRAMPDGMLVGHLAMVDEGFREIEKDGERLAVYSAVCLTIFMLVGFRSVRWALIMIVVVQWSLVVTRAILVLLDWELSMVSSMLSSIVMVVAVATTMHWMFRFHQEYELDEKNSDARSRARGALQRSLSQLIWPIIWACITDAIGFCSLTLSRVGPVQDYGSMMAVACMVVLFGIIALIPTLALLGPDFSGAGPIRSWFRLGQLPGEAWLQRQLQNLLAWVLSHRSVVILGVTLLAVIAIIGSTRLRVETDFLKNFHARSPIAHAYRAVETELGGAGIWDVTVPAPPTITPEYFEMVESLTHDLLAIEIPGFPPLRLTSALSLADTDRVANGSALLRVMPIEARLLGMKQSMGNFFETLLVQKEDKRYLRIMLRARERAESVQKTELITKVQRTVAEHLQRDSWQRIGRSTPTSSDIVASSSTRLSSSDTVHDSNSGSNSGAAGYYILLTRLVEHVVADQWLAFAVATAGIALAMACALRDLRLAIIGLIPAILPNLVVLGVLGWSGTAVNLGAAMIAAVSMGLGVDSSLHYLIRYQREREHGRTLREALQVSQGETGLAVLMATLALVIGFASMGFSEFLPTVAFGTLAAWTMLGGLIGNLCVLPALVSWIAREK
jgi:predicted RND superfamily exporter protein